MLTKLDRTVMPSATLARACVHRDQRSGHVRWADGGAADGGAVGDADGDADAGVEADAGDGPSVSRVKLVFMDKNYCVASKSVR